MEAFSKAAELPAETLVITCDTLKSHTSHNGLKGQNMAFALFVDYRSKAEVVIFLKLFAIRRAAELL